jgi:hypothetical protein
MLRPALTRRTLLASTAGGLIAAGLPRFALAQDAQRGGRLIVAADS